MTPVPEGRLDGGQQLAFDGMAPVAGDLYRNRHTGQICTVVATIQRKTLWVQLRRDGKTTQVPPHILAEHYEPFTYSGAAR